MDGMWFVCVLCACVCVCLAASDHNYVVGRDDDDVDDDHVDDDHNDDA